MNKTIAFLFLVVTFFSSCEEPEGGLETTVSGYLIDAKTRQPLTNYPIELFEDEVCFMCGYGKDLTNSYQTDNNGYFSFTFITEAKKHYFVKAPYDANYVSLFYYALNEGKPNSLIMEMHQKQMVKITIKNKLHQVTPGNYCYINFNHVYNKVVVNEWIDKNNNVVSESSDQYDNIDFNMTTKDSVTFYGFLLKGAKYSASLRLNCEPKDTTITKTFHTTMADSILLDFEF